MRCGDETDTSLMMLRAHVSANNKLNILAWSFEGWRHLSQEKKINKSDSSHDCNAADEDDGNVDEYTRP